MRRESWGGPRTSLGLRCFLTRSSFRWTDLLDDDDLGKIDRVVDTDCGEDILGLLTSLVEERLVSHRACWGRPCEPT